MDLRLACNNQIDFKTATGKKHTHTQTHEKFTAWEPPARPPVRVLYRKTGHKPNWTAKSRGQPKQKRRQQAWQGPKAAFTTQGTGMVHRQLQRTEINTLQDKQMTPPPPPPPPTPPLPSENLKSQRERERGCLPTTTFEHLLPFCRPTTEKSKIVSPTTICFVSSRKSPSSLTSLLYILLMFFFIFLRPPFPPRL